MRMLIALSFVIVLLVGPRAFSAEGEPAPPDAMKAQERLVQAIQALEAKVADQAARLAAQDQTINNLEQQIAYLRKDTKALQDNHAKLESAVKDLLSASQTKDAKER